MKNALKKGIYYLTIFIIALCQSGMVQAFATTTRAIGDDPGITISSPIEINPNANVELQVNVFGSAGAFDEDGIVKVSIPKSIVYDKTGNDIVNSTTLGDPFFFGTPAIVDDGTGNWVLNIQYDHTKIPANEAFSATIYVKFQAKGYLANDPSAPESVDFTSELSDLSGLLSSDNSTSKVNKTSYGRPFFQKLSTLRKDTILGINNVNILDPNYAGRNIFAIIVNYTERELKNVVISDIIPEDTKIVDPDKYVPASGDDTVYNHFRIAKVTSWNDVTGGPGTFEYVTSQFSDKIHITETGFTVELGDISEGYVLMYGQDFDHSLTSSEFGVRYNKASLQADDNVSQTTKLPMALPSNSYDQATLLKTVDEKTLATTSGELHYNLKLSVHQGTIPAGTVVSDPFPPGVTYSETVEHDSNYFSNPVYDSETNTVSYTLLKELVAGENSTIKIKALLSDTSLKPGEKITNKASYSFSGTNIYSNDAVTTLDGSAYLYKTDSETSIPLAGAVFKVIDSKGNLIEKELTSNKDGFVNSGLLPPGDYQFIETKPPVGYELDQTPINFKVESGQTTPINLNMTNKLSLGGVVLMKTDQETGEALQGAIFELQSSDGTKIQSKLATDSDGKLTITDLKPGNYQLVETNAPDGYELDVSPIPFIIEKGQTEFVKVNKTNSIKLGSVTLTKLDDSDGSVLQGAVFKLQRSDGKELQNGLITGLDGRLTINDLRPGDYQLVETNAPSGYELDSAPISFTIKKNQTETLQIDKTNKLISGNVVLTKTDNNSGATLQGAVFELQTKEGSSLQSGLVTGTDGTLSIKNLRPGDYQLVETKAPTGYELDSTPISFTIKKNQAETLQINKTNQLQSGGVILTKKDENTHSTLQGAIFELQRRDGSVISSDWITGKDGKLSISELLPGDYQLVEIKSPTGYELDSTPVLFTIEKEQKVAVEVMKTNKLITGGVILTKVDGETNAVLSGAIFDLKNEEGTIIQKDLTTGADGKLAVNNLIPGNYELVEKVAPAGYKLDSKATKFSVKGNQTKPVILTIKNMPIPGAVVLEKIDQQTGERLSGAEFKLEDESGKIISKNLATDNQGKLCIENLSTGKYHLIETKAPKGYIVDSTPIIFEIKKEHNEIQKVKKVNRGKSKNVRLLKIDADTDIGIEGVEFKLIDADGKILNSKLTTDKDGVILLDNLKNGNYSLIETRAANRYIIDKTPIRFTVSEKNELISIKKWNKKEWSQITLPNTGSEKSFWMYICGIIVILISIILLIVNKRKNSY